MTSPTPEMVSRVARAMWEADPALYYLMQKQCEAKARLAISAMREPTAAMTDAGECVSGRPVDPVDVWVATIDAALSKPLARAGGMTSTTPQLSTPEMVEILTDLAAHAPDEDMLMPDRFAAEPPTWATWEDMGMHGAKCGRCNSWVEVVRPGKTQCPTCGDDNLTALAIRAKAVLASQGGGRS